MGRILECIDCCGVERTFVFAPMSDVRVHETTSDSLDDIRTHNDFCADLCSRARGFRSHLAHVGWPLVR